MPGEYFEDGEKELFLSAVYMPFLMCANVVKILDKNYFPKKVVSLKI